MPATVTAEGDSLAELIDGVEYRRLARTPTSAER